ncbi:MAG: anaerobic ribonucleoside triphosphate reductase [Firmicutes bacterium]|nr:anaerobic ribonucleoside triphosphate reductase [Bacillota bacterium]
MIKTIVKRDGRRVNYSLDKVIYAINKAMDACGRATDEEEAISLAKLVEEILVEKFSKQSPTVEEVQDVVEQVLMDNGYVFVAKKYILYRAERARLREMGTKLFKTYEEITKSDSEESDSKRENANIDGNTPMGTMLKYGSEGSKDYCFKNVLAPEAIKAHESGEIHIHDLDFYTLTLTCCQIDIVELFKGGFSTGHGFLREPNDIMSYGALAAIAIQANQNDQHGGQSIPAFDYGLAPGVVKSYKKIYAINIYKAISFFDDKVTREKVKEFYKKLEETSSLYPKLAAMTGFSKLEAAELAKSFKLESGQIKKVQAFAVKNTKVEVEKSTHQAMEAFVHNLNTMHSRAGAQVPFSSINYGTDTSEEGRLVVKCLLEATYQGLGRGETPIFPIQIFKVKEGISFNEGDPNHDLFKLAIKVSAKRLFPNFAFLDAPFNLQYYRPGRPETEAVYMGCRTRVIGNTFDSEREIVNGRGNLSFTTVNLPRIAIESKGSLDMFFSMLEMRMELVTRQLLHRFDVMKKKKVRNFPFLMGQGVWIDSKKLGRNEIIEEVIKHGTLSIGFVGLAEALTALVGKHHGENKKARILGIEVISFMRDFCERKAKELRLNFSLIATPAESLAGRALRLDRKKFGVIAGVTDKDYYTNGFHVPVGYKVSAHDKIKIEAPYHALTNAGHITYVEVDGEMAKNLEAFEQIIRFMKEQGIGYGSVNHPIDRDPLCGYNGIIGDNCPGCGRSDEEVPFDRIRRITGYLVGTVDRFNNAKQAEEKDRVKHK